MGVGIVWRKCSCRVAQSGQRSCTSRVAQSWELRNLSKAVAQAKLRNPTSCAILRVAQAELRNSGSCASGVAQSWELRRPSFAILVAQSGEVAESDFIPWCFSKKKTMLIIATTRRNLHQLACELVNHGNCRLSGLSFARVQVWKPFAVAKTRT